MLLNVKLGMSTSYHPTAYGQSERTQSTPEGLCCFNPNIKEIGMAYNLFWFHLFIIVLVRFVYSIHPSWMEASHDMVAA